MNLSEEPRPTKLLLVSSLAQNLSYLTKTKSITIDWMSDIYESLTGQK